MSEGAGEIRKAGGGLLTRHVAEDPLTSTRKTVGDLHLIKSTLELDRGVGNALQINQETRAGGGDGIPSVSTLTADTIPARASARPRGRPRGARRRGRRGGNRPTQTDEAARSSGGSQGGSMSKLEKFSEVGMTLPTRISWRTLKTSLIQGLGTSSSFTRFRRARKQWKGRDLWRGRILSSEMQRLRRIAFGVWGGRVARWVARKPRIAPLNPAESSGTPRPPKGVPNGGRPPKGVPFGGKLMSWNIGTVCGRRDLIRHLVEKEGLQVLCLQETLRTEKQFPLHVRGFTVFEAVAPSAQEAARRGLATMVRSTYNPSQVGRYHTNFQLVKIPSPRDGKDWIIANVYVPHKRVVPHRERGEGDLSPSAVLRDLQEAINEVLGTHPSAKVLVVGDFNMKQTAALLKLRRTRDQLSGIKFRGSQISYHGSRHHRGSSIDFMLGNQNGAMHVDGCRVIRKWDDSTHWPIAIDIRLPFNRITKPSEGVKYDRKKFSSIMKDGSWTRILRDLEDNPAEDKGSDYVVAHAQHLLKDALVLPSKESRRTIFSRLEKRLVREKQKAHVEWVYARDVEATALKKKWRDAQKAFRDAHKAAKLKRWLKFVETGASAMRNYDYKRAWRFVFNAVGQPKGPLRVNPVRDRNGIVHGDPNDVSRVWMDHYRVLGDATEIRHMDEAYWANALSDSPMLEILEGINERITEQELMTALRRMKNWKAPGVSKIPTEFWKTAWEEDGECRSGFAKVLLWACNNLLEEGPTPKMAESTIVSLFKDGDPLDPGNYRGISLMDSMLKIVCTIVSDRISKQLEATGRLVTEQGGFRTREECVAQAASLIEIVQRRRALKQKTWVAFLDFQKAFDLVPHGGLMAKCARIGIRGKTLNFLKSLYAHSSARTRTGHLLSEPFPLERGVRQGCPLSPLLFLIFINDLFRKGPPGVRVPHKEGWLVNSCPGLLFADDAVALAEEPSDMRRSLANLDQWSKTNGMKFGIKKCGIMEFTTPDLGNDVPEPRFYLDGERIPCVTSYKYLGITITPSLDFKLHRDALYAKGERAYKMFYPFLRNWHIPLGIRIMASRALIVPRLMYGLELGPNAVSYTHRFDRLVTKVNKALLRIRPTDTSTSGRALHKELKTTPVIERVRFARLRVFLKYAAQARATWLTRLVVDGTNWKYLTQTWCRATETLRIKWDVPHGTHVTREYRQRYLQRTHSREEEIMREKRRGLVSVERLNAFVLRPRVEASSIVPEENFGLNVLLKMRLNAFWTAQKMSRFAGSRGNCPVCKQPTAEDINHYLAICPVWEADRKESGLRELLDELQRGEDAAEPDELGAQLLGEQLLGDRNQQGDLASRRAGYGLFTQVANFLGRTYLRRLNIVHGEQARGAGHPSSTTSQRRN